MAMPTRQDCLQLLEKNVPDKVKQHSLMVNKVAMDLANRFRKKGVNIDLDLVDRASLLHDIAKISSSNVINNDHAIKGYIMLKDREGYELIAEVIKKHEVKSIIDPETRPITWEEKIVFYADKRVIHDKKVPLAERIAYLKQKYPSHIEIITRAEPLIYEMEREIFEIIGESPDSL